MKKKYIYPMWHFVSKIFFSLWKDHIIPIYHIPSYSKYSQNFLSCTIYGHINNVLCNHEILSLNENLKRLSNYNVPNRNILHYNLLKLLISKLCLNIRLLLHQKDQFILRFHILLQYSMSFSYLEVYIN